MKDNRSDGDKTFDTSLLSKAQVEHHTVASSPEMDALREVLSDIGADLQRVGIAPREMKHVGSFSVHIYAPESLKGTYAFVSVCSPQKTFFKLAEAGVKKLMGDVQQMYRGKFQRTRSGFAGG